MQLLIAMFVFTSPLCIPWADRSRFPVPHYPLRPVAGSRFVDTTSSISDWRKSTSRTISYPTRLGTVPSASWTSRWDLSVYMYTFLPVCRQRSYVPLSSKGITMKLLLNFVWMALKSQLCVPYRLQQSALFPLDVFTVLLVG